MCSARSSARSSVCCARFAQRNWAPMAANVMFTTIYYNCVQYLYILNMKALRREKEAIELFDEHVLSFNGRDGMPFQLVRPALHLTNPCYVRVLEIKILLLKGFWFFFRLCGRAAFCLSLTPHTFSFQTSLPDHVQKTRA